jgi:hypothetical protein
LRHCCYYWLSSNEPQTKNESTRTIRIPDTNLLTPAVLTDLIMLERARREGQQ